MFAEHLNGSFMFLSVESRLCFSSKKMVIKSLGFKQTNLNLELMVCTPCLVKILPDASVA